MAAIRPAIDRVYPLQEVAAALRRLDNGDVSGKVVIGIRQGT
jgi:NADPH:quinone reductase-like Zn-dependent oxidoreductase